MNTLAWARKYIKWGWSVIPVKGKVPLIPWTEYRTRLPIEKELQTWFENTDNQLGIVTGHLSGLSVVDVDSRKSLSSFRSKVRCVTPHGEHYYYRYDERLKNYVKPSGQVFDIRTEGGFVVAPPTPNYRWCNPWFNPSQLEPFPDHILPEVAVEEKKNKPGWIGEALNELREGNRDDTFTKVIGRLHYDGHCSDDILVLLSPYAESSSFGISNLRSKIEHIINDYPNNRIQPEEDSDSLTKFLESITPVKWICEPIIGQGTLGFIAGLPETLKTWISMDLAIAVASGTKWLNKYPIQKGKVLFIDQERYKGEVQRRLRLLMNGKGLSTQDLENNLVVKSQTTTRLDLEESFNAFRKRLDDIRPSLVIVDSFATFHTKNENDRRDIQTVLERCKQLRAEFGCTILFIDHENKSVFSEEEASHSPNAFKLVGSVGKPAAAETVFVVRKLSETDVVLYHVKSTIAPTIEPVKLTIRDVNGGVVIS